MAITKDKLIDLLVNAKSKSETKRLVATAVEDLLRDEREKYEAAVFKVVCKDFCKMKNDNRKCQAIVGWPTTTLKRCPLLKEIRELLEKGVDGVG